MVAIEVIQQLRAHMLLVELLGLTGDSATFAFPSPAVCGGLLGVCQGRLPPQRLRRRLLDERMVQQVWPAQAVTGPLVEETLPSSVQLTLTRQPTTAQRSWCEVLICQRVRCLYRNCMLYKVSKDG